MSSEEMMDISELQNSVILRMNTSGFDARVDTGLANSCADLFLGDTRNNR